VSGGNFEIVLGLHPSHTDSVYPIMMNLFELRGHTEEIAEYTSAVVESVPFDLTSLTSHREILLLPESIPVVRIKKMMEIQGLLNLSRNNVYFQPVPSFSAKRVKKFSMTDGVAVSEIGYKLRDTGLELNFEEEKNLSISFRSKCDRERFLQCFDEHVLAPSPLPSLSIATELWRNCKISNFAYLMFLNHLAGRSENDIGQYPVLPWTLLSGAPRDLMTSPDRFQDPSLYRDLSKAVSALDETRLAQSVLRASQMGESEKFLFGSFYSNPGFVLYFLLRKFPECHLRLHGGHFDHPARLFNSFESLANSPAMTMELIPEFYSDWEQASSWLNSVPSMTNVCPVELPEWCDGSPEKFVIGLRCALESKVVSDQLHLWIDLVFGVKSRVSGICMEANNLFHPICYLTDTETDVKDYCLTHEMNESVVILQSQEFGHVPKQLSQTEHHPQRDCSKWDKRVSDPTVYKRVCSLGWREEIGGVVG
jgi:factor associated with neutral sphingomyelinase activation